MMLVRKILAMKVDGPPWENDRPKRLWMKVVKMDMNTCDLSENLVQGRSKWRNRRDKGLMTMMMMMMLGKYSCESIPHHITMRDNIVRATL